MYKTIKHIHENKNDINEKNGYKHYDKNVNNHKQSKHIYFDENKYKQEGNGC